MNGGRYFLDTNIFVYTFDPLADKKRRIATELIRSAKRDGLAVISFQVIQEFCSVAIRKSEQTPTVGELRSYVLSVMAPLCEVHSSIELYDSCLDIREQTDYSFYDSLIVAAAAASGCQTLYTEDLDDGRSVAGVNIVNPF
ncbi:MAG: PIN domain-containing protein [Phycisphaerae bacterium]|jgi:predicted nucleic acid-binding protein|nr:PIN domain-containing protein [Phycisphaerae bacterium]